ncbi:MAG: single-stranded-DNA-specific exonuclease RecJ [Treponema sp.]|nr:single-stranded-DNA-specific exonuclease RecJ [Treponema sp.]
MKWIKKDISQDMVKDLAVKYGCDYLTASILLRRGIVRGEDIRYYLEDDARHLHNPFELPGMEDAVERILAAKDEGEKVLVFGDRDVDGITGTAMVAGYLQSIGIDTSWRIPVGNDPYGLSVRAVEEFAAGYGTLIITVDCGISNRAEVEKAGELAVDVIITDHHNPQEEIPQALAVVNPKLPESRYPFRDLSGCGVAFKLVSALRFALKSQLYGQPVCLLNTRPLNDAFIVEIAKLRNLAVIDTLTETLIPGMVGIGSTRLPRFLEGQQILAWDGALQKRVLGKIFGTGVEVGMLDIAGEIGKEIPQAAGKSLLRIKELSRIAKYADRDYTELDVFVSLFQSFIEKKEKLFTEAENQDLQLAALGTVADIMPLKDENRIIVKRGITSLQEKPRPGLHELLLKLDLAGRPLRNSEVSWQICPALNAAGRMGSPEKAASLLLEKDPAERGRLAGEVVKMNTERKKLGEEVWTIAEPMARDNLKDFDNKLALAYGEKIHRGVTGIMANRLADLFKLPALVVSFKENAATGSLRSPRGTDFTVLPLLEQCADLLIDWGGHDFAAGFSLDKPNWGAFLDRLKTACYTIELEQTEETVNVDAELPQSYLNPDIFKTVDRFEPYGEANETLTFLTRGIKIADIKLMGSELKHVKLNLDAGKYKWPALYWQAADKAKREFDIGDSVDMVFKFNWNWYNGTETPQIIVTDLRRP